MFVIWKKHDLYERTIEFRIRWLAQFVGLFFDISTNICNVTISQKISETYTVGYKNTQDVP